MTLGAVAEGLHEQLHGERGIDKETVKRLRADASAAVPEEYQERVFGALSQLGGQSFRDRLEWLSGNLEPFATQLCGSREAQADNSNGQKVSGAAPKSPRSVWVTNLMAARNNFAHQKPENPQDLDEYVRRALALRDVARWFVAACIVRELEIPVEEIEREFKRRSSFHLSMRRARMAFPDMFGAASEEQGPLIDFEMEE
jgi:hypothetical protein